MMPDEDRAAIREIDADRHRERFEAMPDDERAVVRALDAERHQDRRQVMADEERAVIRALDAERHQIQYDEARYIIPPRLPRTARAKTIDDFQEQDVRIHR
jgi:hypothetical protein